MPLVHRKVIPVHVSNNKLRLGKTDSEFVAVNNGTFVAILRQLASLVSAASEIFSGVSTLTGELQGRIKSVGQRLNELEIKTELFDPKLIHVPEGSLDLNGNGEVTKVRVTETPESNFFLVDSRPDFLVKLYAAAGNYEPNLPPRLPVLHAENNGSVPSRDGQLGTTDEKQKQAAVSPKEILGVQKRFPGEVMVSVDVTGSIFDRMKANRRSLLIYTKRIRGKKKRRNTICGSLPNNKECGIQTSLHSVTPGTPTTTSEGGGQRKYGVDSGHWSSTESSGHADCSSPAMSPWSPSSDFCFDEDEDRTLTPQLENFTDGMVSDSDSVDTEGYFTSFRNECGFPKSKKIKGEGEDAKKGESEYELFGQGSTSTTASSCGTVVMRQKLELPNHILDKETESETNWEERVKRKSLIERIPSLVVVTPTPSCSSRSTPPKEYEDDFGEHDKDDLLDKEEELLARLKRAGSFSTLSTDSHDSTDTLTPQLPPTLPQPDVIADVYQLVIKSTPSKLDSSVEYCSLETPMVLLGSFSEEQPPLDPVSKMDPNPNLLLTSATIRGARVVLDANGEIIFSSETFRRKRKHKVSFDPGEAVVPPIYDSHVTRERDSVYDRLRQHSDQDGNEKLYECIQEIRRNNLRESEAMFQNGVGEERESPSSQLLLETDLDSAIPPVMPELKTLPKIKDCLKRNESYRMATDDGPKRTLAQQIHQSAAQLSKNSLMETLRRNRGIPEEDPAFIQQVLNFGHQGRSDGVESPGIPSKFPMSPDDRPSFLRRDSPPTMEEISKQIYQFRKKFNIQPIALSRKLCTPAQSPPKPPPRALPPTFIPKTPPPPPPERFVTTRLRETSFTTPLRPVQARNTALTSGANQKRLPSTTNEKSVGAPLAPQPKSVSFTALPHKEHSNVSLRPHTSLTHFKRLLASASARGSPGKSTVSAVEILRPRLLGQETKL